MANQQQTLPVEQAINLAMEHYNQGQLSQAESIFQQIVAAEPNHPIALHLLGVIAHQLGSKDSAHDLIAKSIQVKPDYAEAHYNLGKALQDQKSLRRLLLFFVNRWLSNPTTTRHYTTLPTD